MKEKKSKSPRARAAHRWTERQTTAVGAVEGVRLRRETTAILDQGRREGWSADKTVARLRKHFTKAK